MIYSCEVYPAISFGIPKRSRVQDVAASFSPIDAISNAICNNSGRQYGMGHGSGELYADGESYWWQCFAASSVRMRKAKNHGGVPPLPAAIGLHQQGSRSADYRTSVYILLVTTVLVLKHSVGARADSLDLAHVARGSEAPRYCAGVCGTLVPVKCDIKLLHPVSHATSSVLGSYALRSFHANACGCKSERRKHPLGFYRSKRRLLEAIVLLFRHVTPFSSSSVCRSRSFLIFYRCWSFMVPLKARLNILLRSATMFVWGLPHHLHILN